MQSLAKKKHAHCALPRSTGQTCTARGRGRFAYAFTLLEMLIVLAIVCILSGLLVPVLLNSRKHALRDVCLSNLHQTATALSLYTQDYEGSYPGFRVDPIDAAHAGDLLFWHSHFCRATHLLPGQITWVTLTSPYVSRTLQPGENRQDVFFCPADHDRAARPQTSYELKMYLAEGGQVTGMQDAAGIAVLWDQWDYHDPHHYSEHDIRAVLDTVFADGHAKALRLSDTTSAICGNGPDLHWRYHSASHAGCGDGAGDVLR